ncbi:MAG TPA: YtxH domain-containing protein [Rubrobacteraceae bacterium]|nr:YtxH domain-containing protein [Rubrobacteraceae bacterium]
MDKQRLRAFLLGGAAGLLAGVILAPRSGREMRGSIADRAGEARERSRETLFEAQERLQERRAAAREGSHRRARDSDAATIGEPEVAPQPPGELGRQDPEPLRPRLHEVPRDLAEETPDESAGREAERSEELRRKVQQTRARLRERLVTPPESGEGSQDHDDDPGPPR